MPNRDWVSLKEAGRILGLKRDAMRRLCKNGTLDAKRVIHQGCYWWAITPESVQRVAEQGKEEQAKRDAGYEWCCDCGWKKREEFGRYGKKKVKDAYCIPCRNAKNVEWRKGRKKFAGFGTDRVLADLSELIAEGPPVKPEDSLKYACMDVGFAHRPVPIGQTKRQAFCSKCEAKNCVHHPELTPEEVRRNGQVPTRYPERRIVLTS